MPINSAAAAKPITIAQIARAAGVSQGSVSAFLNNREYGIRLSKETRKQIMSACRELNYRPKNPAALARIYPAMGDICFLLNSGVPGGVQHQYFGQMLAGVIASLEDPTGHVAYSLFDPKVDYLQEPGRLPQSLRTGSATKCIAASAPNPTLVRAVLQQNLPFAYLGHSLEMPGLCCIVPDYAEATRLSVRHLAGLGHQRIAYLTGPFGDKTYNLLELQRGFVEGMEECRLPLVPHYIYHCAFDQGNFGAEQLAQAVDHLMALHPCPTAIMCFHDPAATVVSAHLQAKGFRVPQDISVMGCNDEPAAATHHPALTTIHFPLVEMGRRAVRELETQIQCGRPDRAVKIELPVRLVERVSCAPPPAE